MDAPAPVSPEPDPIPADALLAWYDRHRRVLPWRAVPGETADPYHVWLSEIMLQQTSVAAAIPYYHRFLSLFPTIEHLAAASEPAVMQVWAGLGYYARARNLHACARAVAARGGFPRDMAGLRALPGIGAYTAAAIAAIAYGVPAVPVDGNVERVAARMFGVAAPLPGARPAIAAAASRLNRAPEAQARPSDFAQALFDLGATICTPRNPACALCPWMRPCSARALGTAGTLPAKTAKPARPQRHGAAFMLTDDEDRVLLRRRAQSGLLGGMTDLPGTEWRPLPWSEDEALGWLLTWAPAPVAWRRVGAVRHVFTHFALDLDVYAGSITELPASRLAHGFLCSATALQGEALPTLTRKCLALARG